MQSYKNKSKLFSPSISCSDDTGQQQGNLGGSGPPILGNHNKVEKNLKGILDSIPSPSPSVKIQIMDGKCVKAKYWGILLTKF